VAKINSQVARYRFRVHGVRSTVYIPHSWGFRAADRETLVVSGKKDGYGHHSVEVLVPYHSGGVQLGSTPPHKNTGNLRVFESALKTP
jgi:hypothetical protein